MPVIPTDLDPQELTSTLRELVQRSDRHTLRESLHEVLDACVQMFGVTGSGLMISDDQGVLRYAVATDGPGRQLEDVQLESGEGPCVDTFVHDRPTTTPDLARDERWPVVASRVGPLGVHGMVGVPVHLGDVPIGSLDVYLDRPHEWSAAQLQALVRYAEVSGTLMSTAISAHRAGELAGQLEYALDHRVVIERGIGYLMARDGLAHGDAFQRLRRSARSSRRRIGEVAAQLLDTGRLPDDG